MKGISLAELIEDIRGCVVDGNPSLEISQIQYDSRKIRTGDLFVAVQGDREDGHSYVGDAVKRGAIAVVVERDVEVPLEVTKVVVPDSRAALSRVASVYFGRPSRRMEITGVTGTNGKTTTCYLLKSIYGAAGLNAGMITTVEYVIGHKKKRATLTTPESLDLQEILRSMAESGVHAVAMEVSSHGLVQKRVKDVDFSNAVFTNLTRDHLDFHGDMESYLSSKKMLFQAMTIGGIAAMNCDDPHWQEMVADTRARVIKYGFSEGADLRATGIEATLQGTKIDVTWNGKSLELESPLVGRHNAYNMMASAAAALSSGVEDYSVALGIKRLKKVPGRVEAFDLPNGARAFVDYAHTPDALFKVLGSLKEVTGGRVICVFGCGGDRDKGKRPMMGEVSASLADHVIVTSDNPRREDPASIILDITKGIKGHNYKVEPDRRKAIEEALRMTGSGDCVLVAGKGHEDYQIVGELRLPFDDRKVISELIERGELWSA
jgi:UDP-N-acetylmuramoyl-L-alanyl-D-glutamate--2,6-diaminopimelate ligase